MSCSIICIIIITLYINNTSYRMMNTINSCGQPETIIRNAIAKQKNVAMTYLWLRLRIWLISFTTGLWTKGQRLRILMSAIKNTLISSCIWCIWWCIASSRTINTMSWWSLFHTFSSTLYVLLVTCASSILSQSTYFSTVLCRALTSPLMLHTFRL